LAGLFSILNTAQRGLTAQQKALETTGHNVANANTPGFSRQRTVLETTPALPVPSMNRPGGAGQVGTGVEVAEIVRVRDSFLDAQIQREAGALGEWQEQQKLLERIEVIFMEPSESGLNNLLTQFWNGWQELSKNAESSPVRTALKETAESLAEAFRHSAQQLDQLEDDLNSSLKGLVDEVNSLAEQISDLNNQIKVITLNGDNPNDLLDRRDLLLDELAKLTDFSAEKTDGTVDLKIGDQYLVDDALPGGYQTWSADSSTGEIKWSDGSPVNVESGTIKGIDEAQGIAQDYHQQIDILARSLINRINEQHQNGYDLNGNPGLEFFSGTEAADFALAVTDVSTIAAASFGGGAGDGSNALAIAQLKNQRWDLNDDETEDETELVESTGPGEVSFDDFYKNLIARLGVQGHEAGRMVENQSVLLNQLENRRTSVSGVSIDEEMTQMLQFQRAYQASAKMITAVDELLDTLINRML